MNVVAKLARPEILALKPVVLNPSPRGWTRLHANENPHSYESTRDDEVRCYPEPYPDEVERELAELYGVAPNQVIATRGSDEAIDLLVRAFCTAGRDAIMVFPPTFGMYELSAQIQGARVHRVPVAKHNGFDIDEGLVVSSFLPGTKLIFLCAPNNPTGNLVASGVAEALLRRYESSSVVVLDEAYIEFSDRPSFAARLTEFENLVVLRTLSKAHGLAGARCGVALASPAIIELLRRIRPPYALASSTVAEVVAITSKERRAHTRNAIETIRSERARMHGALRDCRLVRKVWPSEANFLLVECTDAAVVLARATRAKILLRDFRATPGLEDSLRITVGARKDNDEVLSIVGDP